MSTAEIKKKTYEAPKLDVFGEVSVMTASGTSGNPEGGSARSDKRA